MLTPGTKAPALKVETLDHGTFDLSADHGETGTLVIMYRGKHCPICIKQMGEVENALDGFAEQGIEVIMLSADGPEKARATVEKAEVSRLRVGYGLSLRAARDEWDLYISSAREGSAEPDFFSEPGIFFVKPDGTLQYIWKQSTPFARPTMKDILGGLKFTRENDYPARGTYTGDLPS
ncbi:redoxin domain-containing protein [Lutimaribacter marinistellae]|uniref:Redoxin domain-containing protein n=1 Tax=Lutimaribacter marinistellae TaxID=1820329 RepID=A0ABV7TA77_9RHOB